MEDWSGTKRLMDFEEGETSEFDKAQKQQTEIYIEFLLSEIDKLYNLLELSLNYLAPDGQMYKDINDFLK